MAKGGWSYHRGGLFGDIRENMLGLAATGWAEVDRSVNGQLRISQKVLFSKICPSAGAHGAQKSCKSTALAEPHKRHLNDHFGKDAAFAIVGLATTLPAEILPLPISCRLGRWRRAIRASPLASAAGPAVFWIPDGAGQQCLKRNQTRSGINVFATTLLCSIVAGSYF